MNQKLSLISAGQRATFESYESRIIKLQLGVFTLKEKLAKKNQKTTEFRKKQKLEMSGLLAKFQGQESQIQQLSIEKATLSSDVKNLALSTSHKDQQVSNLLQEIQKLNLNQLDESKKKGKPPASKTYPSARPDERQFGGQPEGG